jgi:hypothetical protein
MLAALHMRQSLRSIRSTPKPPLAVVYLRKAESSLVMNFTIEFFRTRPSDEAHATLDRISIVADNLNAATVNAKSG